MFITQLIQEYLVLQGGILSAHFLECILLLVQVLSKRGIFGKRWGSLLH